MLKSDLLRKVIRFLWVTLFAFSLSTSLMCIFSGEAIIYGLIFTALNGYMLKELLYTGYAPGFEPKAEVKDLMPTDWICDIGGVWITIGRARLFFKRSRNSSSGSPSLRSVPSA
jgi:hypothetical protein